jgi:hypothetical protein
MKFGDVSWLEWVGDYAPTLREQFARVPTPPDDDDIAIDNDIDVDDFLAASGDPSTSAAENTGATDDVGAHDAGSEGDDDDFPEIVAAPIPSPPQRPPKRARTGDRPPMRHAKRPGSPDPRDQFLDGTPSIPVRSSRLILLCLAKLLILRLPRRATDAHARNMLATSAPMSPVVPVLVARSTPKDVTSPASRPSPRSPALLILHLPADRPVQRSQSHPASLSHQLHKGNSSSQGTVARRGPAMDSERVSTQ